MSELIPVQEMGISNYTENDFALISRASGFLPRLQLFGSNSNAVKEAKIPIAHWGLVEGKDSIVDLGPIVQAIPCAWRPRAMKIETGKNPVSYFDLKDPEFAKVKEASAIPNSGNMYGPEFLLYLPSVKKFCTYFMNSKTNRRVAPDVLNQLNKGQGITLKIHLIKTQQYTWHGPQVFPCTDVLDTPTPDVLMEEVTRFRNPPKSQEDLEIAPQDAQPQRDR